MNLNFPTDKEVINMGEQAFIKLYMRNSYLIEFGSLDSFENWQSVYHETFNSCANNAIDIYDEIIQNTKN